jgi:hypothetical protein
MEHEDGLKKENGNNQDKILITDALGREGEPKDLDLHDTYNQIDDALAFILKNARSIQKTQEQSHQLRRNTWTRRSKVSVTISIWSDQMSTRRPGPQQTAPIARGAP